MQNIWIFEFYRISCQKFENPKLITQLKLKTKMKALVDQIKAEYEVFAKNAEAQVEKGNKAAGARARKAALNLMKAMKEFRKVSVEATK